MIIIKYIIFFILSFVLNNTISFKTTLHKRNSLNTYVYDNNNMNSLSNIKVLKHIDAINHLITNANYLLPPALYTYEFSKWLKATSIRKLTSDTEFIARITLRELKRNNLSMLTKLEDDLLIAKTNYMNTATSSRIEQLDKEIVGGEQAITSMQKFLTSSITNSHNIDNNKDNSSSIDNSSINNNNDNNNNKEDPMVACDDKSMKFSNDVLIDNPINEILLSVKTDNIIIDNSTDNNDITTDNRNISNVEYIANCLCSNKDSSTTIANKDENNINSMYNKSINNYTILPIAILPTNTKLATKLEHVRELLPIKLEEVSSKIQLRQKLREETSEYGIYKQKVEKCNSFYEEIGLIKAMETITTSHKYGGHGRNNRGRKFEDTAADIIKEYLIPDVAKKYNLSEKDIFAIRNIKLSMASFKGSTAELDCLLCIAAERPKRLGNMKQKGIFCKVLAVVEIKRNSDDIGEAFMGYQSALTWLAGYEDCYDPEHWKTRAYPTGHFKSRPFIQIQNDSTYTINTNHNELIEDIDKNNNEIDREIVIDNISSITTQEYDNQVIANTIVVTSQEDDVKKGYMFTPESFADLKRSFIDESNNPNFNCIDDYMNVNMKCNHSIYSENIHRHIHRIDEEINNKSKLIPVFIEDLYFITKDGNIDNISSKSASWALNKFSSEIEFDYEFSDNHAIELLRNRMQMKYPYRLGTIQLLELYKKYNLLNQIYVATKL